MLNYSRKSLMKTQVLVTFWEVKSLPISLLNTYTHGIRGRKKRITLPDIQTRGAGENQRPLIDDIWTCRLAEQLE